MEKYNHRQTGLTMPAIFGGAILLLLWFVYTSDIGYAGWLAIATAVFAVSLFSSLTIVVDADVLRWSFGPGLVRKAVAVEDIAAVDATRTRWWEGWGIRITRRGWLYNVWGLDAVVIRLKSGKQFLLGTDDAERLAQVLAMAIKP